MKIFVATCDRYDHLLKGFARQFNKYWGKDQQVTVLGFRRPPSPLPDNFAFHSMEPVETREWTTNLRLFFETVDEHHWLFLLDDYWLINPVDHQLVAKLEQLVIDGAAKGDLSRNTVYFDHTDAGEFVEATMTAQYRTSTQPAIWSRDYLLPLLEKDLNPWEFELQDSVHKIRRGRILGLRQQVYDYANVYFKGKPHHMVELISPEDMAGLRDIGAFDGFSCQPSL